MAIELQVSSVTALVIGEPKERQIYKGKGDKRESAGRLTDAEGRPVSGVSAVVMAEPLGMLGDATVLLPDIQAAGLVPGAIIRIEGSHDGAAGGRRLRGHPGHGDRRAGDPDRSVAGLDRSGSSGEGRRGTRGLTWTRAAHFFCR